MSIININILKQFLQHQYARHLVFKTENTEILLMCWLPGQGSPRHNHGSSDAITLVLEGEMSYTTYYPDKTKVSGVLCPGDMEHIPLGVEHEARNNSDKKLVTLHIYSPPLENGLTEPSYECDSLGYANKVKVEKLQVSEKTISFMMADKPVSISFDSENDKSLTSIDKNKKPKRTTIAIIGGGFSGTLVATHLMKKATTTPIQIMLIERAPKFARGFAYSTSSPMHLLNVPAGKMSAFPNDPDHFLKWAKGRDQNIDGKTFVPRMLYGEYLETVLHEADLNKSSEVSFKRLNDEAISIEPKSHGAIIHLESGINLPVNQVVLAVGNYPPKNPNVKQSSFYKSQRYVRDPWSAKSLAMISPDDAVLMVGTGLTMVDKAVELKCRGHRGTIHAISRHGLLPQSHSLNASPVTIDFKSFPEPYTVKNLLKFVIEKSKSTVKNGGDWRSVMDALRPHIQTLWSLLPINEKQRFFRHVRPYWDVHRHRIPPHVFEIINSMLKSGQLKIHTGRIKDYLENENCVSVIMNEKNKPKPTTLEVSRVINCTGSELDFCQIQDPLIVSLLQQGFIAPDKLSLGLEAHPSGALKDINGNVSKMLYTLGPPLKGQLWETTAVPEIREQAAKLADEITKNISEMLLNPEVNELSYVI